MQSCVSDALVIFAPNETLSSYNPGAVMQPPPGGAAVVSHSPLCSREVVQFAVREIVYSSSRGNLVINKGSEGQIWVWGWILCFVRGKKSCMEIRLWDMALILFLLLQTPFLMPWPHEDSRAATFLLLMLQELMLMQPLHESHTAYHCLSTKYTKM